MLGFSSAASRRNRWTARYCSIWYRFLIATLLLLGGKISWPPGARVATFYELTGILKRISKVVLGVVLIGAGSLCVLRGIVFLYAAVGKTRQSHAVPAAVR
jgi:hypothetical protein